VGEGRWEMGDGRWEMEEGRRKKKNLKLET
jgi:hypothetical protein